jgi:hypothetical protein
LSAQALAVVLVIGSYFIARRQKGAYPAVAPASPA